MSENESESTENKEEQYEDPIAEGMGIIIATLAPTGDQF